MMRRRTIAVFVLVVLVGMWGCAEDGSLLPMGGECGDGTVDPGEGCDDGNMMDGDGCDSDCMPEGGIAPTLAAIQANIFTPICTECHVPGGPGPMPLTSEAVSYANLVDVPSNSSALDRVEPGNADASYLVHKVEDRPGIGGTRMPPPPRPMLTTDQINAIVGWINNGAEP